MSYVNNGNNLAEQFKQALQPQKFQLERGGPTVLLKRVGLMDLIQQGRIPDRLSAMATKMASRVAQTEMSEKELRRFSEVVDAVCCAAFVEPRLTVDGDADADSVAVGDVPWVWRVKVFNWASNSAGVLLPFRGEQAGALEDA